MDQHVEQELLLGLGVFGWRHEVERNETVPSLRLIPVFSW
jgi:hypothetical protein